MMPHKRAYILRIVLALALAGAACEGLYQWVVYRNRHFFSAFRNAQVVFEDTTGYDLVLLGSSRMKNVVNPYYLDSVLGVSSINIGQSKANLAEEELLLSHYLSNHPPPRYLLLGLDLFSLKTQGEELGTVVTYTQYLKHSDLERLMHKTGIHTGLYKLLPFLKIMEFSDYNKSPILNYPGQTEQPGDIFYKGYFSNTLATMDPIDNIDSVSRIKPVLNTVDTGGRNSLLRIVHACQVYNIKLAFLYAPEYKQLNAHRVVNLQEILAYYYQVANRYNIPFLRHDSLAISNDNTMFLNAGHLNRTGSTIYSRILADSLRSIGWHR